VVEVKPPPPTGKANPLHEVSKPGITRHSSTVVLERQSIPVHQSPKLLARKLGIPVGQIKSVRQDYWIDANSPLLTLEKDMQKSIRECFTHGSVRCANTNISVQQNQMGKVLPLPKRYWPRTNRGAAWPSSPTFQEWLEMSRKGITLPGTLDRGPGTTRVSFREFNSNIELAKRIVTNNVIGVRADLELPDKYLKHFRYRWNFLILTTPWDIPAGLARFLASCWITKPTSLWLEDRRSLRSYLRQVPVLLIKKAEAFAVRLASYADESDSSGSSYTASDSGSDY